MYDNFKIYSNLHLNGSTELFQLYNCFETISDKELLNCFSLILKLNLLTDFNNTLYSEKYHNFILSGLFNNTWDNVKYPEKDSPVVNDSYWNIVLENIHTKEPIQDNTICPLVTPEVGIEIVKPIQTFFKHNTNNIPVRGKKISKYNISTFACNDLTNFLINSPIDFKPWLLNTKINTPDVPSTTILYLNNLVKDLID